MLPGFENITKSLTEKEIKTLVPVFIAGFKDKIGKQNAVTSTEIIDKIFKCYNVKLTDSTVRKIINYIRNNNLVNGVLIAYSGGYYISHDPQEIKKYIQSLEGRLNEITRIKQGCIDQLRKLQSRVQSKMYQ